MYPSYVHHHNLMMKFFLATHEGNINVSWGKMDTRDRVHESSQPKTEGRDAVSKFPRFVSGPTRVFPKPRVSNFHSATPVLTSSRDRQDARQCHADDSQECLGVHHRSPHVTPAGPCSSTGDSPVIEDENDQDPSMNSSELNQTMTNMLQELQNQRTVLQGLVTAQTLSSSSPPTRSRASQALTAGATTTARTNPGNVPRSTSMMTQVMQALPSAPSNRSSSPAGTTTSAWILAPDHPGLIGMMRMPIPSSPPTVITSTTAQPRTIGTWGQTQIVWGKKHKGKTYLEVYQNDIGYYHWSLARFNSLPENQQDFVKFCQVRAEMDNRSLSR